MSATMRAAVLYGVQDLRVEDVPRLQLTAPHQALVRVRAVGICGSDIHYWQHGRIGDFVVREPLILGHEAAGEIVAVGAAVTHLQPGQRVAIEPGYPDGICRFCREGRYNLCPNVIFMATPPVNGAFCEYVVWPADFLYPLPDNLSLEEGALVEPLSVAIHAVRRTGLQPGQTVAILGAGPIGLCALAVALAGGATTTIVTDTVPSRLKLAQQCGATHVLPVGAANFQEIMDITAGAGVDICLECAGAIAAIELALRITRRGGVVQLVGMPAETHPAVPIYELISRELAVGGLFRYAHTYPVGIALLASGKVSLRSLITHHFSLEETPQAMRWVASHKEEVIKAFIHP